MKKMKLKIIFLVLVCFLQISNSFVFGVGHPTDEEGNKICVLCLDVLIKKYSEIRILSCEHGFHKDCFEQMLDEAHPDVAIRCPVCSLEHGQINLKKIIDHISGFDVLEQLIIQHKEDGRVVNLYLRLRRSITEIPEYFFEGMDNLVFLDLSGNRLKSLPDSIGNLIKLEKLNLSGNRLTSLPDSIGNLTNLKRLDLSRNKLRSLPDSIGNLTSLESLNLEINKLRSLPNLEALTDLAYLNISFNRFWRKPSLPGGIRIYLFPQFIKDDKAIVFVVMSAMSMVKVLMLLRYNFNKGK